MKTDVKKYLDSVCPELIDLVKSIRLLVLNHLPGSEEIIYHNALNYSISKTVFDRICYIAPQNGYVNLGFCFGAQLADPDSLMEGTGIRMRHIKIRSKTQLASPFIAKLLINAWKAGPDCVAALHESRKRKTVLE